MTAIHLADVVLDMDIYPRAEWSQPTVERYVEALEAGDRFPPIILETGTNRLLDGMHRYQAHKRLGREEITAEHHVIPTGEPPKLYAAGLSARHGDRMSGKDLQAVAREVADQYPEYPQTEIAKRLSVSQQTISRWTRDVSERHESVRVLQVFLLLRTGIKQVDAARIAGVSQPTVSRIQNTHVSDLNIDEALLRKALDGIVDAFSGVCEVPEAFLDRCEAVAEEIREERIFAAWSDEERNLLKRLRDGETVTVSMRDDGHPNLARWAEDADLFVRIDRRSEWGNPFEMPADGDRDTVVRNYAEHYLPCKPSLLSRIGELRGKALGCWCAPEPCHGDVLKAVAEQ